MQTNHRSRNPAWQHTLAGEFTCVGRGLHGGRRVSMRLRPAPPGTGIRFLRLDVDAGQRVVTAHWRNVVESELCTIITNEHGVTVRTVEHLLAALRGCEIDNAVVELDGPEVPIMDGSAAPFVSLLQRIGAVRQPAVRRALLVRQPVVASDGDRFAVFLPYPRPRITVEIDFPNPTIGRQRRSLALDSGEFASEIAPARTFGFAHGLRALRARGLAAGGSLRNAILVDERRVVNQEGLRFPDEFVRHKLLDCVGDLSLLGIPVIGHLVAYKPGHRLCHRLLHALDAAADAASLIVPGVDGRHSESVHSESPPGEHVVPAGSATRRSSHQGDRS
ncbi:MAG TPA: UDP-3-O-acyl-N-acetylglucosamine deacetylase [Sulfuricaulis sp.]|nr:UDP-3-O-acyl-N-acetylglucosamine deacetylase [Sulfuricaulis sp.]